MQLNASGAASYAWSPVSWLDNPTIADPVARPEKNVNYVVTGTDANGCTSTDTVFIEVFNIDFVPSDTFVCQGDSIQLSAKIQGDGLGISYNWTPGLEFKDNTMESPKVSPTFSRWYQLNVINMGGCVDIDSVYVNVRTSANPNFEYVNSPRCDGSVLEIENTSTNSLNFQWKLNGKTVSYENDPDFAIDFTRQNLVTLISSNEECSDSLQKVIEAVDFKEIFNFKDANVFTPNGDGINDLFDPGFEGEYIGCVDFKIYDRWGVKVFDSNIGQYGWDGRTLRGSRAPVGIYYYIINVAGKEIKGSIYLNR